MVGFPASRVSFQVCHKSTPKVKPDHLGKLEAGPSDVGMNSINHGNKDSVMKPSGISISSIRLGFCSWLI